MSNLIITNGQQRVREIVYQMLPEYQGLMTTKGECDIDFFGRVRDNFASDPIITADPCLCQSLSKPNLSDEYTNYLRSISKSAGTTEIISNGEYFVALDKFFFNSSSTKELPVYFSDDSHRWFSTFSCLFGFAEGKDLDKLEWVSEYFAEDGILKVGGNGSHRLMACVLWGQHLIKPQTLYIIKAKADPELHSALLLVDKILQDGVDNKYKYWFRFKHYDRINATDTREQLFTEAEEIKKFYRTVTDEEIVMIRGLLSSDDHRSCLHRYYPFLDSRSVNILSIGVLLKIVWESRAINSRNIFQRFTSRLFRSYNYKHGNLSVFELWTLGLPPFRDVSHRR